MAAIVISALSGGCDTGGSPAGTASRERAALVPDVTGEPLDQAADVLEASGLAHEPIGGGFPTSSDEHTWVVCDQRPRPGQPLDEASGSLVHLKVARRGRCASPTH